MGNWWMSALWGLSLLLVGASLVWAQDQHDEVVWKWMPERLQQQVNKIRDWKNLTLKQ